MPGFVNYGKEGQLRGHQKGDVDSSTVIFSQEGRVIISSTVNGNDVPPAQLGSFIAPIMGESLTFFPSSMMPDDPLGLLQKKQIQEELELSKEQIITVEELQKDIQRQMTEVFTTQAKFGGNAAQMVEAANKAIRENITKELKEVLLPKQMKRLGQLEVQMKLRNRGVRALAEGKLAERLQISDGQKKEIREQSAEMQKELQQQIEMLRERLRKRLIKDVLDKEQLVQLEEVTGDEFDVQQPNVRRLFQ